MRDYYKILRLKFGASDTEIKKQYRKLASIYHPDKNGSSKKSEEDFKVIANAYQTLSNKKSREVYDLQYKENFKRPYFEQNHQYGPSDKREYSKQASQRSKEYQESKSFKSNYRLFWFILYIVLIIYFFYTNNKLTLTNGNANKSHTTGNPEADEQLKQQKTQERPESGELNF